MDNQKKLKQSVFGSLFWKFGERISAQLVTFFVSIVLARILTPADYGIIAIVNIFITIANVFVVSGFGNALIQKKDADETDFSTVFYFNIFIGVLLYGIIFLIAPVVAKFYNLPILCPLLRVLGLRIVIASVNNIQHAYVAKHMMFKKFFWSTLGGTIGSAIVGISMVYMGCGVWSLVGQYMFNTIIDTVVLWFTVKWRPRILFSFKRLSSLFSFGWKLLLSALLNTVYNDLRSLVIGKVYNPNELAFYNKGKSFPNLIVSNINTSIQSVLFPAMADCQDEKQQVKVMMRRSISMSSYIMLPLMCGLALVAKPLISFLLTEKWLSCVPFLQITCFTYAFMPIHTANLQAIQALGRSDIFLKLEIIKKVIGVIVLVVVMRYGVMAIALSGIFTTIFASIVNAHPNKKLVDYSYFEQIKDMFNGIIPLAAMVAIVWLAGMLKLSPILMLCMQIPVGAVVYILVSKITHNESFQYVLNMIKKLVKRK